MARVSGHSVQGRLADCGVDSETVRPDVTCAWVHVRKQALVQALAPSPITHTLPGDVGRGGG